MDSRIQLEYASVDGETFESGEKKLRLKNIRIRVEGTSMFCKSHAMYLKTQFLTKT